MKLGELPEWVSNPDPSLYWSDNYVTLDFETTILDKGSPLNPDNRIVLACWKEGPDGDMRSVFGGEYEMGELVEAVSRADFIVAHNTKFELGWLKRAGVDLRRVVSYDTMIAEYVLGGNRKVLQMLSMSLCLKGRGFSPKRDLIGIMLKAGLCPSTMPESWLLEYCKRDVEACHELFVATRKDLRKGGMEAINYQRNLVSPALTDIEFNGMQLDEGQVNELTKSMEEEYARTTSELQDFCEGAEPTSPKQLQSFVYDNLAFSIPVDHKHRPMVTKSGTPSVAADVLSRLKATTSKQQEFLTLHKQWAGLHSDVTKYLRKFGLCCKEAGGSLFGTFNQCSTRTHRLSSSGLRYKVQFQNLNRRLKPLICARKSGWLVGEADGAQLEFRVAVHLGRDRVGLESITSGEDIHAYTASIIGCSRQDAKPHTFKPLYGGISGTERERTYYEAFAAKYHGVADTQRSWCDRVLEDQMLTTEWGMKYYWPGTRRSRSGYVTNTTSIFNYPVQAFATAEIIPCAIVCAWHRMVNMESFMVNTVHDSIIAEVHPEEVGDWHDVAKQCLIEDTYKMINQLYGVELTVPLGAGVMVSANWGDKVAKDSEVVYTAADEMWKPAALREGMLG